MLGELDFYLPKSFCSTNVYGEYTEGKNSIVGLIPGGYKNLYISYLQGSEVLVYYAMLSQLIFDKT